MSVGAMCTRQLWVDLLSCLTWLNDCISESNHRGLYRRRGYKVTVEHANSGNVADDIVSRLPFEQLDLNDPRFKKLSGEVSKIWSATQQNATVWK